jgi:hypothetical protein
MRCWSRLCLLGSILLSSVTPGYAQKEALTWYFGTQVGVDFAAGAPQPLANSARRGGAAAVTLSDPQTGQLLFYSDAEHVWNRQHQLMPHGDSLLGFRNTSQGVLALPVPGQARQYYLFTLRSSAGAASLFYSVVDMRLAGGLGDVMAAHKNQPLAGEVNYQLAAVPHANGHDYWLLTRVWNSNRFDVYLVSAQGITLAQTQAIGPGQARLNDVEGFLKASPNGQKLAYGTSGSLPLSLFDFDPATGQLSHYVNLGRLLSVGGLSFSPDNSKLYVQNYSLLPNQGPDGRLRNILSQFDLAAGSDAAIAASGLSIVGDNPTTNIKADEQTSSGFYTLQLGPDGRLYGNSAYVDATVPQVDGQENMYVINAPNRRGFACDVQYQPFRYGRGSAAPGLPNFLESYFNGLEPTAAPTGSCAASELSVYPNPSTGLFQVHVPETCFIPYQVLVYDARGRLVYQQAIATALSPLLDLSAFAPGTYFLALRFPQQTVWRKLTKASA